MSCTEWAVRCRERLSKYNFSGNEICITTSQLCPSRIEAAIENTFMIEHSCDSIKLDLKK